MSAAPGWRSSGPPAGGRDDARRPARARVSRPRRSSPSRLSARPESSLTGATVQGLHDDTIEGFDLALFSAGAGVSREWAPRFVDAGATVIDNSSAFRRDPRRPAGRLRGQPPRTRGTSRADLKPQLLDHADAVALGPIHRAVGIERLVVATYQSVSGTGQKAIDELDAQAHASLHGTEMPAPEIYPQPIGFNVIGAAGSFAEGDDHTDEERKMMFETRKILEDESIGVAVTCVRVPVRVEPLGGGQRPDSRAALGRACTGAA